MKTKAPFFTVFILLSCVSITLAQQNSGDEINFPRMTLTNHVEFFDSASNNPLAGCAFLLETNKGIFAITCKHSLWVAKSEEMKGVHFEGTLKEWRMRRKDDTTKFVITERLLNEDRTELIGENNVDADYLVFSIKENNSDVQPVKLRETKLKQNDPVYIVGWSFADKTGPQRIYKARYFKSIKNRILIEHEDDGNLAGTSGSPVVDEDGNLVGIVSNYTFDEETQKWYGSPCSTDYLKKIIDLQ